MSSVAIVGPVSPYRGGIAQHTEMLYRAMETVCDDVLVCSFTRQYPRALFPGESDKAPEKMWLSDDNVRYLIDSVNPLTWHRAVKEIASFGPDLVVIPFWTWFWAPCFGYLIRKLQNKGLQVRVICHNVADHETAWWKSAMSNWAIRTADGFLAQASTEAAKLRELYPEKPVLLQPHPVYSQFPASKNPPQRKAEIELLFYGFIRRYKGLDILLEALSECQNVDWHLRVAGEFWEGRALIGNIIDRYGLHERVDLIPRYLDDDETADVFTCADALVLPYRDATGSGVLGIAIHYGKPVIATEVGSLADIVSHGETGYLVHPNDKLALASFHGDIAAVVRMVGVRPPL